MAFGHLYIYGCLRDNCGLDLPGFTLDFALVLTSYCFIEGSWSVYRCIFNIVGSEVPC